MGPMELSYSSVECANPQSSMPPQIDPEVNMEIAGEARTACTDVATGLV